MGNQIQSRAIITILIFCLLATTFLMTGCAGSPGMTASEIDRRHHRYIHSNWLMFQDDLDSILMSDRPSRLTPIRSR